MDEYNPREAQDPCAEAVNTAMREFAELYPNISVESPQGRADITCARELFVRAWWSSREGGIESLLRLAREKAKARRIKNRMACWMAAAQRAFPKRAGRCVLAPC